jgi:hypothetical protein
MITKGESSKPSSDTGQGIKIRCNNDHTLLFIARDIRQGEIETICRKCKQKRLIKFPVIVKAQA